MEPQAKTVQAKDWYRAGFNDGRHGNPKWRPGDKISNAEYDRGFKEGRDELNRNR